MAESKYVKIFCHVCACVFVNCACVCLLCGCVGVYAIVVGMSKK